MKAADVVRQLRAVLPKVTDLFSEVISIASLTRSGTTVTATTSTDHGLTTGNSIVITGALTPTDISSLTFLDGIATAETATSHDLTIGWESAKPSDNAQITVIGANEAAYNGNHVFQEVPNRTKFTYPVSGTPASPATGSPQLLEQFNSGYNGVHTITVTSTTTFTYEITQTPNSPAQGTINVYKGIRVTRAVNTQRIEEAYTKKSTNKLWAFVVLGDVISSKDREVESDATTMIGAGTDIHHRLLTPFSVFVLVPDTNEIAGANARDLMEDIRPFLYKSLLGVKFNTGLSSQTKYGSIAEGDGFSGYSGAVYTHEFKFNNMTDIVYADIKDPDDNVAFRNIELEFLDDEDTVELTANVNLDEEP